MKTLEPENDLTTEAINSDSFGGRIKKDYNDGTACKLVFVSLQLSGGVFYHQLQIALLSLSRAQLQEEYECGR